MRGDGRFSQRWSHIIMPYFLQWHRYIYFSRDSSWIDRSRPLQIFTGLISFMTKSTTIAGINFDRRLSLESFTGLTIP